MDPSLKAKLRELRPKLSLIAPLTYYICWGFAVVNFLIGAGMYFLYLKNPAVPIAIASFLNYQQWGVIFFTLGIFFTYGLLVNKWKITRYSLFLGLAIKSIWAIALIIRSFSAPTTLLITAVWLFIAYIEFLTYIFFFTGKVNRND